MFRTSHPPLAEDLRERVGRNTWPGGGGMLKAITVITVLLLSLGTKGQTYFEGLYGDPATASGIGPERLAHFGDSYLVWSNKFSFQTFRFALWSFTVDMEGNLTQEMQPETPDSISDQAGKLLVINDTMIVGLSQQRVLSQPSSEQGDMVLTCLSPMGQVYWRQVYGLPDRTENPTRFIRCSNGGYAIVGQVVLPQGPDGSGMVYLIRTDSLGNPLWERMYGGSLYDAGNDLIETPDGGFMLLGWTRSFGAGNRDFYLVKTDSLGNQQWQKTYGDANFDSGHSIIVLSDGTYLLGGYRNLNERRQGYLYKVDELGTVIWENDYGDDTTTEEFHKILELPNGDIVAAGLYDPYGAAPQSDNGGLLVRITGEGDEIWRRVYQKNQYTDLFYSVLATEDGGFLLGGQAWNEETSSQDAWLLKVDSVGCPYPNCITGMDEQESRVAVVDVWPNPCTDVLHMEMSGNSGQLEVQVLDISGREVLRHTQHEARGTLDVGHWQSGVYVLRGMDGSGRSFSMKIVKQ